MKIDRQQFLIKAIESHPTYKEIYKLGYENGKTSTWNLVRFIAKSPKYILNKIFNKTNTEDIILENEREDVQKKISEHILNN